MRYAPRIFVPGPATPAAGQNLWHVSLAALAVANTLDVQSSWGKHELNATLANPEGRFGSQGALVKLAMQASLVGIELLLAHKHPSGKLYRALAAMNLSAAASIGAVAGHNYTIPR